MGKSVGMKVGIIVAVVVVAVAAFVARGMRRSSGPEDTADAASPTGAMLPRLVDLGSKTCIPCKMMEPILEELRHEYRGRLKVEFIDVKVAPDAGRQYGIAIIPTQIWFDASGKELIRHEGFISKADILAVFSEHGLMTIREKQVE